MEFSWKYDIQNGYAKIIPPKIPDRISLMLIITILQLPSRGRIFDSVIVRFLTILLMNC
jgi:hypothetical protein